MGQIKTMKTGTQNRIRYLQQSREEKARRILKIGKPLLVEEDIYLVPSQFSKRKYKVTYFDSYACSCKDFEYKCRGKGIYCKHIRAVLLFKKIKDKYKLKTETEKPIELVIKDPQKKCCPHCQSEKLIGRGKRRTKLGEKQRYGCKDCKKRFVLSPIKKIKGNVKLVCLAMDCYYKGLSYRDIVDQFQQFYGLKLHHETIRRWVLRFSKVLNKYSKTLTPKTSGVWNADETMILTKRGKNKKKQTSNYDYVWNVIDNKSKFLLASLSSGRGRSTKDAKKVFVEAWEQNVKMPNQIITDKLKQYQAATRKVFRNYGYGRKIKHTSILGKRRIVNNNAIESHHTHQKEFYKVRRGVTNVQDYADGFKVYHNFIRKNVKDKTTPSEKCGIDIDGNRWHTLLISAINNK